MLVVCGCGPSLHELAEPQRFVTIGVNDVGRLFDPAYLVVVNLRTQFKPERFRYIEQSNARALFTQLDLGRVHPPVVRFRLGQYGGTDDGDGQVLHYAQNSPDARSAAESGRRLVPGPAPTPDVCRSPGRAAKLRAQRRNVPDHHDLHRAAPEHRYGWGKWRTLNFNLPPFDFPEPMLVINEKCTEADGAFKDKSLGVWRLADLPLHLPPDPDVRRAI